MDHSGPEDTSILNVPPANPTIPMLPGSTELDLVTAIQLIDQQFIPPTGLVYINRSDGGELPWTILPRGSLYPWLGHDEQPTQEDGLIAQKFATVDDLAWSYGQRIIGANFRASATNTLLRELLLLADAIPRTLNNLEAARRYRARQVWASRRPLAYMMMRLLPPESRHQLFRGLHDGFLPLDWDHAVPYMPEPPIMDEFPDETRLPTIPLPPNGFIIPALPPPTEQTGEKLYEQAGLCNGPAEGWIKSGDIPERKMWVIDRALDECRFINASSWAELRLHEYARRCELYAIVLQPVVFDFGESFLEYTVTAAGQKRARDAEKRLFGRRMANLHPRLHGNDPPRAAPSPEAAPGLPSDASASEDDGTDADDGPLPGPGSTRPTAHRPPANSASQDSEPASPAGDAP